MALNRTRQLEIESEPTHRLSDEAVAEIRALVPNYPEARGALLPALWVAQREHGWVSRELSEQVAEVLDIPVTWVYEVLSFYVLFHTRPVGRHTIWVCRNLSCALRGYEGILAHLEDRLGIRDGETTADGEFTLMTNECLGACGGAPMMQLDDHYYEDLTPERVDEILERVRSDRP